ncbi:MAG: hypothetical protein IPK79_05870 [Vampirovibrionales bacterium]|nr:hypothetical protein [Vampirovibrionales bacterium]
MAQWFVNGLYVNGATMTTTPAPYVGRVTQDANPKQSSVVVDAGLALNELKPTPDAPDSEEFVMAFPSASKGEARTLTFRRDLRDPNGGERRACAAYLGAQKGDASVILALSLPDIEAHCDSLAVYGGTKRDGLILDAENPPSSVRPYRNKESGGKPYGSLSYPFLTLEIPKALKPEWAPSPGMLGAGDELPEAVIRYASELHARTPVKPKTISPPSQETAPAGPLPSGKAYKI